MSRTKQEWREKVLDPALGRFPERQESFVTSSGADLDTVYAPDDLSNFGYDHSLSYPGEYPFTRGIQPSTYRGRLWSMRQYSGFASADESNRRFRYLLEQGQTGLSVAFDLPTQIGYDSDHPLARGEVGKVGVPVCTLGDMEVLLEGIPLERVSTSMTVNATAPIHLAMYIAVARKQGVDPAKLDGTIQNDILKEYIARGTYIFPPHPSMRLITDIFKYCGREVPRWNTISVGGYHIREAGSTAAQEVAFALANAIAYVRAGLEAGQDVDAFAGRISWIFQTHNNLFEEVAKLRAARRLWARVMQERFDAKDPRSWMFRTHVQTGGSTLTAQQPENNVVRATLQTLAAVLGGVQSLAVSSYDEALCLPTEESVQLSLRTQQVIAYESGVADVADPLGGSYLVEHLTGQMEDEVVVYLDKIEKLGGAASAIEQGFQQREIQESSYRAHQETERGERVVVGVNKFVSSSSPRVVSMKIDPNEAEGQRERLARVKRERDGVRVSKALEDLGEAARGVQNTMPHFLEAVEAYATLGEICDVLRGVFGSQREVLVI